MSKIKVISVVGARPNFIKVAPLHDEFLKYSSRFEHFICHTGQHFDWNMSSVFFKELKLPEPHFYLGVGSGSHAQQTAEIMIEFEKVMIQEEPDLVIVVGDVNSTLACSITSVKLNTKVAHVEAGLRSFDNTMPEEINRKITDAVADYLFVSEPSGLKNLKAEGVSDSGVFYVGNIMIDTLISCLPTVEQSSILEKLRLNGGDYILITFHRPSNVDHKEGLSKLIIFLNHLAKDIPIVFPIHPRTRGKLEKFGLTEKLSGNILLTDPIGYIDFIALEKNARLVITDSGGIQEETTYLAIPCITVRKNTERPITVDVGTNILGGTDFAKIKLYADEILSGKIKKGQIPEFWDGHVAQRIVGILNKLFD
jgi:UDP-N-acetylglucosamine 2-epimerase (non-hydrolysing)